MIDNYNLI